MKRIKLTEAQIKMLQDLDKNRIIKISESQFIRLFEDIAEIPTTSDEVISDLKICKLFDRDGNTRGYFLGRTRFNPNVREYFIESRNSEIRKTEAEVCHDYDTGDYLEDILETNSDFDLSKAIVVGDPKDSCNISIENYKPSSSSNKASSKITQNFKDGGKGMGIKFEAEDMERKTLTTNKVGSVMSDTDSGPTPHIPRPELKLTNKSYFKKSEIIPLDLFNRFKEGYVKEFPDSKIVTEKDKNNKDVVKGYRIGTTHVDWKYITIDNELHSDMDNNEVYYYVDKVKAIKKPLASGKRPRIKKEESLLPVGMGDDFEPQTIPQNEKTTQSFNEMDIEDVPKILAMGEFAQYLIEFLKDLMVDETAKGISPIWNTLGQDRNTLLAQLSSLGMIGTVPIHGANKFKVYKYNFKENIQDLYNKIVQPQPTIEETTGASSSGAFVAPMGAPIIKRTLATENDVPKITMFSDEAGIEAKHKEEDESIDEETTAASSGSYVSPKVWAKTKKDMKFGKKPMYPHGKIVESENIEETEGKTQYPDGEMVTFDKCVTPGHNDVNINGGCSVGAVDGVVKLKKTKGSVISKDALYYEVAKKTGRTIEEVVEILKRNNVK
jgi:hypothetical protein